MKTTDLTYLNPLYKFCNFLALAPPHIFGNTITRVSTRFKIYTFLHIIVSVLLYGHSSYGRENFVYGGMEKTVVVTDKLANFVLTFLNVLLRILLVFYNAVPMKKFFNLAYEISTHEMFTCCGEKKFKIHFAIFNAYMVTVIFFDAYLWINTVGVEMFQYYVGRSFAYYVCNVSVFFIFHSVLPIKHFFTSLSSSLEVVAKNLLCNDENDKRELFFNEFQFKNVTENASDDCCYDLTRFRKYYNKISELVDAFNTIYGMVIVIVITVVITYVLNLTDLLLVYGVDRKNHINGRQYGTDLIILCGLWMITLLIFTILLAYGCAGAISESEKVFKICFYWLNELPTLPTSKKDITLKEEFSLLAQQSTSRGPKFSAAGFFPVDFTLLGFIFGTVTSYIIISLQFIEH